MAWCLSIIFCLSFITISCHAVIQCESGDCAIDCSSQNCHTVICTNQASSCNITCTASDCEGSHFYLAASNTNLVTCDGSDSCKHINIQCGLPSSLPSPYTVGDFIGHVNKCEFILQNNAIPDQGTIQCINDIDLCQVSAITNNDDFKDSTFNCQLSPAQAQCVMDCNTAKSCGDSTSVYNCIAAECICNGNGCDQIHRTSSKSSYTDDDEEQPTLEPTMEPAIGSNIRTAIPTISGLYTDTPTNTNRLSVTGDPTKSPTPRPTRSPNAGVISVEDPSSKSPTLLPTNLPTIDVQSDNEEDTPISAITDTKPPTMTPTSKIITNYQLFDSKLNKKNSNDMIWILSGIIFGLFCISCGICICISVCCDCSDKQEDIENVDNHSYETESGDKICPYPENPSTPSYVKHFNNRDPNENSHNIKGFKHRYSFTEDNDVIVIEDRVKNKQLQIKDKPLPPCIKHQAADTLHSHLPKFGRCGTNELKMEEAKEIEYDQKRTDSSLSEVPSIPTPTDKMMNKRHHLNSASSNESGSISEQNLQIYHEPEENKDIQIRITNHRKSSGNKWVKDASGKWNKNTLDVY